VVPLVRLLADTGNGLELGGAEAVVYTYAAGDAAAVPDRVGDATGCAIDCGTLVAARQAVRGAQRASIRAPGSRMDRAA
jgi:hypothetical protein